MVQEARGVGEGTLDCCCTWQQGGEESGVGQRCSSQVMLVVVYLHTALAVLCVVGCTICIESGHDGGGVWPGGFGGG
jgi:hypothetical protein